MEARGVLLVTLNTGYATHENVSRAAKAVFSIVESSRVVVLHFQVCVDLVACGLLP